MEFKSLTNIETSFRQIRLFALVFICLCALVTGFAVWNSYSFAEKQRQKIYVLDNGKSLMLALSQDMAQNRPVEAKSHVRRFHELFFTLSPEKGAIESNIKRSLFLADKTAFNYYKDLAEKGYYNRVISGNVTQTVEIDSVKCDFDQYPYKVNTYARQLIVRESSLTVRSLVTSCRLLNATRSDNNPHGFIIEAFTITENKDLQTIKRQPYGEKTKPHRKGAGLGGRPPAPNVRTDYAGQKAGGYPPDVLLFRRLVYLHHRFINLQYRETGRAKAANRTHQTTAVARQ